MRLEVNGLGGVQRQRFGFGNLDLTGAGISIFIRGGDRGSTGANGLQLAGRESVIHHTQTVLIIAGEGDIAAQIIEGAALHAEPKVLSLNGKPSCRFSEVDGSSLGALCQLQRRFVRLIGHRVDLDGIRPVRDAMECVVYVAALIHTRTLDDHMGAVSTVLVIVPADDILAVCFRREGKDVGRIELIYVPGVSEITAERKPLGLVQGPFLIRLNRDRACGFLTILIGGGDGSCTSTDGP